MKRIFGVLALLLGMNTAAYAMMNATMSCPASVQAGKPLEVQVVVENWADATLNISSADVFVVGNSSQNTLFSMNFFGPYRKTAFGPLSVPSWGAVNFKVRVMEAVPVSLAGKMAIVTLQMKDPYYDAIRDSGCDMYVY